MCLYHSLTQGLTTEEAFRLYMIMLAGCHVERGFIDFLVNGKKTVRFKALKIVETREEFLDAVKLVEGVLCTYRESALGSSAWGYGEFVQALQSKPFFYGVRSVILLYIYF